ncbi:MAG TPA: DUF5316 family protein [Bacillus sp. (in: firmicutes)]|uniref:DUF5316 family protein n=1 Tax=Bacillus litorisediminis TaxID=2922713 RepID=UPI001FAC35BD|nr:DUF5316 family protein [Bacillus litorisediminis]HWO78268.1 DUF5316 family protein [Bacillus sp. (in: firmicutes)]
MFQFFLFVGVTCFIISGLLVGAWVSGDRQRGNFHSETAVDRRLRTKIAYISFLVGILAFVISGIIYFLFKD